MAGSGMIDMAFKLSATKIYLQFLVSMVYLNYAITPKQITQEERKMASLNELLQEMVNKDYEELVIQAKAAMVHVMPSCKAVDKDHNGILMLTTLILTAIAADGVMTALERKMLGEVTGLDAKGVDTMISLYDSRMVDLADHFVDNMGDAVKAHALMLVLAFIAVDEKISKEEVRLVHKLLN